jgi:hypothetical protein
VKAEYHTQLNEYKKLLELRATRSQCYKKNFFVADEEAKKAKDGATSGVDSVLPDPQILD